MHPPTRTLFLHIGFPKTGTSYLQSCFHFSREVLRSHGIDYPFSGPEYDALANGRPGLLIPGNAIGAFRDLESLAEHLERLRDGTGDVLLSSEAFQVHLDRFEPAGAVVDIANAAGFSRVRFLLFLREPLSYTVSYFAQIVKMAESPLKGMRDVIGLTIANKERMLRYVESLGRQPEVGVTLQNYSRLRERIVPVTEAWLGLSEGSLVRSAFDTLNRSLDPAEECLAAAIKRSLSPPSPYFGAFVEKVPDLPAPLRFPSREEQQFLLDGVRDALASFNRLLPADEMLTFEFREPSPPITEVSFKGTQLEAIGPELSSLWDEQASRSVGHARLRHWWGRRRSKSTGTVGSDRLLAELSASEGMLGSIDLVGGRPATGRRWPLSAGGVVEGWVALDVNRGVPPGSVFLLWEPLDGAVALYTCRPIHRPDVAAHFGQDGLVWSGFLTHAPLETGGAAGRLHLLAYHQGEMYHHGGQVWEVSREPADGV